jgi:hypothetical protein
MLHRSMDGWKAHVAQRESFFAPIAGWTTTPRMTQFIACE